jgi:hypothetical protein
MSKQQTIKAIKMELSRLNQEIDLKIIRGLSYVRESKQHQYLSSQLKKMTSHSWLGKANSFVNTLLF